LAHTGKHFGASFLTWALELKPNTRLTLGRRLTVLSLTDRSFTAERRDGVLSPAVRSGHAFGLNIDFCLPFFQTHSHQPRAE